MNLGNSTNPSEIPAALKATIRAAQPEIDKNSDLPAQLIDELREVGAFRLLTPKEFGGYEVSLAAALRVYEGLGRIDASVGWIVWNANFGFLAALLDETGADQVWRNGDEPIFANSGSPGVAVPVEGGYRVSGTWKIVSGIRHATWLSVIAVVTCDGKPVMTDKGAPDVRLFLLRPGQYTVHDTWQVNGMRGSGSNDVTAENVVVPAELAARFDVPARIDRPLYRGFTPTLVFPGCTAVALGVAQSAIDETVRLAKTKKSVLSSAVLADLPTTHAVMGRSEAALQAARNYLLDAAESIDAAGETATPVTLGQRATLRAAMSHAAQVSREVLVAMYELGSSSSIYDGNPVERQFRDGMVALQHVNHAAGYFEAVGRVRFGMDPGVPLF
ncbi:acyl-CoA dehydrogenase family protein [Amycolatopsis sp. NPDC051373]|uniref:acyl-CoA dehydrogenase family protein n=1 Tax=Amycolatopsis sp. NPDC051373 TaxID=3155801 RepID=UPI00344CA75A